MTTSKKNALAVHKGSDFCDELSQRQFGNATKSNKADATFPLKSLLVHSRCHTEGEPQSWGGAVSYLVKPCSVCSIMLLTPSLVFVATHIVIQNETASFLWKWHQARVPDTQWALSVRSFTYNHHFFCTVELSSQYLSGVYCRVRFVLSGFITHLEQLHQGWIIWSHTASKKQSQNVSARKIIL